MAATGTHLSILVSGGDEAESSAAAAARTRREMMQRRREAEIVTALQPRWREVETAAPAYGEMLQPRREEEPEEKMILFVRLVAFCEWLGNASGTLAWLWATTVLLGGFNSSLDSQDFAYGSVMMLIEAIRVFSGGFKLDRESLFGTTGALMWMKTSFLVLLARPREGTQVTLIMGLWFDIILSIKYFAPYNILILHTAFLITWSRWAQRPKQWHIKATTVAYMFYAAYIFICPALPITRPQERYYSHPKSMPPFLLSYMLPITINIVAVLLFNIRPNILANLTSNPYGHKLILLAKFALAIWFIVVVLAIYPLIAFLPLEIHLEIPLALTTSFTRLILSLGSLQNHTAHSLLSRCIDTILHVFFILHFTAQFPVIIFIHLHLTNRAAIILPYIGMFVLLMIGNLQIPTSVAQVMLSFMPLRKLFGHDISYGKEVHNLVPVLQAFYVLALCQGSLYITTSFLSLFSLFPRRWLVRRLKFRGGKQLGAKAIDVYYQYAYEREMKIGVFGSSSQMISFAEFIIRSLDSKHSLDIQVAGLCVLQNMLERNQCSKELILRVTGSKEILSTLIGIHAWMDVGLEDKYSYFIRLLAARVTTELAGSIAVSSIPTILKHVSALLDAENINAAVVLVPNQQRGAGHQQQQTPPADGSSAAAGAQHPGVQFGWLYWCWQLVKGDQEKPTAWTHQDSLPVMGMVILEKLAGDLDNCVEILNDTSLISTAIGLIGYTGDNSTQQSALVCSSLGFLRRLATTGERIGAQLRHELWSHPFLLNNLARVLEDDPDNSSPQLWEPAMDIIAKLALKKEAGLEIGKTQVIIAKLLHVFFGKDELANNMYDQSLWKVSGEALANLAQCGIENSRAILEEPGYNVINDLKNMITNDEHRFIATSLLQNLCVNASEHLPYILTIVMGHIMAAEGKHLETLINLAYNIGNVTRETLVHELESQTNGGPELVQKLVCTLNSKQIPNPEYPRMRRIIVKIFLFILKYCPCTVQRLKEEGIMEQLRESLRKIERTASPVEKYKAFYGNIGAIPEDEEESISTLVGKAKVQVGLI